MDPPPHIQQLRGHGYLTSIQYGIGVPKGGVATSGAEAEKIAKDIGMRRSE
jgi:succinyl-CoA synthetase beta subunit